MCGRGQGQGQPGVTDLLAGPKGRLPQRQGVHMGTSLTWHFSQNSSGSALSWYNAIAAPQVLRLQRGATSPMFPKQSLHEEFVALLLLSLALVELLTPNRLGRELRGITPLPCFGRPPCSLAENMWMMEGSSSIPLSLCPHCLAGCRTERWPRGVPIPTGVPPHLSPLATIPAPSLLGAPPRHTWSHGLPVLTKALSSGISPAAWDFVSVSQPEPTRPQAHEPPLHPDASSP